MEPDKVIAVILKEARNGVEEELDIYKEYRDKRRLQSLFPVDLSVEDAMRLKEVSTTQIKEEKDAEKYYR